MAKKKVYAIKEGFDFSKNERVQNKLSRLLERMPKVHKRC